MIACGPGAHCGMVGAPNERHAAMLIDCPQPLGPARSPQDLEQCR